MEILPTLDLFNFTEPIAAESQYILTSPRSLEACARFGIKPVELLPKTNEEFEEEYGEFTENLATLYKKFEKERLRKLRLCRQERERIIEENAPDDSDDESISSEPNDKENYRLMDTPHEGDDSLKRKTAERPSILDYLDASSTFPAITSNNLNEEGDVPCRDELTPEQDEQDSGYTCMTPDTPDSLQGMSLVEEEEEEVPLAAKKKKKNDLQRSQSLRVKVDVLPEPIKASASTYSLRSEVENCRSGAGGEEPVATSEKKCELKRSQSLKMKRDVVRNKAAATWKEGRRGGTPFFRTSGALLSSNSHTKAGEVKRSLPAEPCSTPYSVLSDSGSIVMEDVNTDKKKQTKVKRSQSFKLKGEETQDIDIKAMGLAKDIRENPTLISKEDKKMLDQYLLRINTNQKMDTEKECGQCSGSQCSDSNGGSRRIHKSSCCTLADKKNKEGHSNHSNSSKENIDTSEASKWKAKYKNQVQKMDQRLNIIERGRHFGQEIDPNISCNRAPRKPQRSPSIRRGAFIHDELKNDKQMRAEHTAHITDLKAKHKRAGEEFQERMKLKLQQREFNKIKQQERKEFQERQLQAMENDLKLWQEELKNYQNMCSERATRIVSKKNAITSMKTHEKRLQKEMEHAMMKSRVDQEDRQRQEELKMLVNIKDARSKMIINAKQEYVNAGRDCAQLSRSIRSRLQEKEILSSFDKMASKGERMARLERMNSVKRDAAPKVRTQRKNQSMVHLG